MHSGVSTPPKRAESSEERGETSELKAAAIMGPIGGGEGERGFTRDGGVIIQTYI